MHPPYKVENSKNRKIIFETLLRNKKTTMAEVTC